MLPAEKLQDEPQLTGLTLLNPQSLVPGISWLVVFHTVFKDLL